MAINPAQIEKFLDGADYPMNRDDLINLARENGADDEILSTLTKLPDREYDNPMGISSELGKME